MDMKIRKMVLRSLNYGLYVLTTRLDDAYSAATVTWVSQASFEPLLISVAVRKDSGTYKFLKTSGMFALNVVGEGQKDLAASFFKETIHENNTLNGYVFHNGEMGVPILNETPYFMECRVHDIVDGGDHDIFIAEVMHVGVNSDLPSLGLRQTGWSYGG